MIAYADTAGVANAVFEKIVHPVINFLFVAAFVYFIFGIVVFIQGANNKDKREVGKRHMGFGLLGLLVMFGCYTILQLIVNTLKLESPPGGPDYNTIDQR